MSMAEKGNSDHASRQFLQAWTESTNDFEKFTASYYVARSQKDIHNKLKWLETALQFASRINDDSVKAAFAALYSKIAKCHQQLGDPANAKNNYELAISFTGKSSDNGPFYHGTKADQGRGHLLRAG